MILLVTYSIAYFLKIARCFLKNMKISEILLKKLEEAERIENERLAEEARVHDLRVKCEKRGLDFDEENQKYLDKKAKKARK